MVENYGRLTASEIVRLVSTRQVSAVEIVDSALNMAESTGVKLNAVITLCPERAFARAEHIDRLIKDRKATGILSGVPVLLKDNIVYSGCPTTCASKMLKDFNPPYNATVVERLEESGAIIIGKSNMDEFAMGSSNENSFFGPVKNPADNSLVPGGSSGGSAAVVAAGIVPIALGSDTGGSVRQPAGFCGIVGMRPTYGTVSRYGLVAFASSFDQIGPMTGNVRDISLAMSVIAGYDTKDATSININPEEFSCSFTTDNKSQAKIGIIREFADEEMSSEVEQSFNFAVSELRNAGHEVVEVFLPHIKYATACYYIIANAEASSNLACYDGVRYGHKSDASKTLKDFYHCNRGEGFGAEVKRRIMLGTFVLSAGYYDAYYEKAMKIRKLILDAFTNAFESCDILISPTSPTTAFGMGDKLNKPLEMYLSDVFTVAPSLAGIPAISIPIKNVYGHLPIGLQVIGRQSQDASLLQTAYVIEQLLGESHADC